MQYARLAVGVLILAIVPAPAVDKSIIDRAADRGVVALKSMQQSDGTWSHGQIGATALNALALLECDIPKTDRCIVAATKAIREAALTETKTYSVALCLLFLDRLDELSDTPLIESLAVRLVAGQRADGGWSYNTPSLAAEEVRRIRAEMDPSRALVGGRDLSKLPSKGKRNRDDLPKEVRDQLANIERFGGGAIDGPNLSGSDNSNTQFATLGLWVGRRYGVPTQASLIKCSQRFRLSQNADGGWNYTSSGAGALNIGGSSATMTAAGIFVLSAGHGATLDIKKGKDPKLEKEDVSKDISLGAGLIALSSVVGVPVGWNGVAPRHPAVIGASGKAFYFLWSLERAAMVLNLETINRKDWYTWGAEILLANQYPDGSWHGEYATGGVDTAFALLFLKKANLARDLSSSLTTPRGARVLKGGGSLKGLPDLSDIGFGDKSSSGAAMRASAMRPNATTPEEKAAVALGDELLKATPREQADILKKLRDNKGATYTETLVWVISKLDGDAKKQARVALAERLTRLKDATLREYLKDDESEIRRAAALAAAARGSKALVPDLIKGLSDGEDLVRRAAYTALKELTKKDFGPGADASDSLRKTAIAEWEKWWRENNRE